MRLAALAGGTGASKLLRGLLPLLDDPRDLTIVVNTGDDTEIWGLHVSPDLDSVCYTLSGLGDVRRGWGLRDETFHALEHMARYGEPTWFGLGDRDLATHIYRTRLLRAGRTLTEVTALVAAGLGVPPRVLPMSDEPVRTRVLGPDGWLGFQEYFVREKAAIEVRAVEYAGAEAASAAPGVADALRAADAVIVCPSNPVTSIGPMLAVAEIAAALRETAAPVIAVSPIVGGDAVSGPAGRLMASRGLPVSPAGVARAYAPWLDALVLDERDAAAGAAVRAEGARPVSASTLMVDAAAETALARSVLEALR